MEKFCDSYGLGHKFESRAPTFFYFPTRKILRFYEIFTGLWFVRMAIQVHFDFLGEQEMKTSIKQGFRLIQSKSFSNFGKKRNSPFELIRSQVGPDFTDKKNKAKNDSLSAIRAQFSAYNQPNSHTF